MSQWEIRKLTASVTGPGGFHADWFTHEQDKVLIRVSCIYLEYLLLFY